MRNAKGHDDWYEFKRASLVENCSFPAEEWQPARYPGESDSIPNLVVSNHGRVSQADFRSVYRGTPTRDGYYVVHRAGKNLFVHRVVAATFLGQPQTLTMHVNHRDFDPGNNHVQNLEYVTPSQNMIHSWERRARGSRGKAVQARLIAGGCPEWLHFVSLRAAAAHTNVNTQRISDICRGRECDAPWEFKFAVEEPLDDEEWRPVVLQGARRPSR